VGFWSGFQGKVKMPRRINGSIAEVLELRFVVFNLYFQQCVINLTCSSRIASSNSKRLDRYRYFFCFNRPTNSPGFFNLSSFWWAFGWRKRWRIAWLISCKQSTKNACTGDQWGLLPSLGIWRA
jgi:hypothetical protein